MKQFITNSILFIVILLSFAFQQNTVFRPPGTVQIVENFFFDENEITNMDWKEYVSFQKNNYGTSSEMYINTLPDTTVWITKDGNPSTPYINTYYQHPAYNNYPVVGISYGQATAYCKWRTEAVKKMLNANNIVGPKDFFYRLPSKTEWELIANGGFSEKTKKKIAHKKIKVQHLYNMKYKTREKQLATIRDTFQSNGIYLPAPVKAYLPNKHGVYNLFGNVAEMVTEKGIAKGGSWTHYYGDIVPTNKDISYENPTSWLGFRCVCEVEY